MIRHTVASGMHIRWPVPFAGPSTANPACGTASNNRSLGSRRDDVPHAQWNRACAHPSHQRRLKIITHFISIGYTAYIVSPAVSMGTVNDPQALLATRRQKTGADPGPGKLSVGVRRRATRWRANHPQSRSPANAPRTVSLSLVICG